MIQQRVRLSQVAHDRIAGAQRQLGLARFDEALGYFLDGALRTMKPQAVADRMRIGFGERRKRGA